MEEIEDNKVYGIFSGHYSDWSICGFFTNRKDAEKYCAVQNKSGDVWDDESYVMEIKEIKADLKDIKLRYYHEVVFDFGRVNEDNTAGMRNEEDRYEYYIGEDIAPQIAYNVFSDGSGWIAFKFNCDNRKKAEKIAQDKYYQFLYRYSQNNNYAKSAELIGAKKAIAT